MYHIEKDLVKIKRIACEKEDENWEFRSFLKQVDLESDEIDELVHTIYGKVITQIDCTDCANCCSEMSPVLEENDIACFIKGKQIAEDIFIRQYLEPGSEKDSYIFNSRPCPFLENKLCTNYDYRPNACRSYPYLDEPEFVNRLFSVLQNYSLCPIVFNVYEKLKIELKYLSKGYLNDFDDNESGFFN